MPEKGRAISQPPFHWQLYGLGLSVLSLSVKIIFVSIILQIVDAGIK